MKLALFIVMLFGPGTFAWSQLVPADHAAATAKSSPPAGPLLHPAPDFSEWVISYQYPDDKNKKDAPSYVDRRPRKVVTTKTGSIIHEMQTDVVGNVTDTWFAAGTQYLKRDGQNNWLQPGRGVSLDSNPLPSSGFRDLDWITNETFAGTVPFGAGSCFVLVPYGAVKLDSPDDAKQKKALETQAMVAYVDAETRLPVAFRINGETRSYHFNDPPAQMQTLPPDLVNQLTKAREATTRLEQRAPRPY